MSGKRSIEKSNYIIPNDILNVLNKNLRQLNKHKNHKGYNTAHNLIHNNNVSGHNLKRIKHNIENGDKITFHLLGGEKMLNWINSILSMNRTNIENVKKAKKNAGIENAYRKPHEKMNECIIIINGKFLKK